MSFLRQFVLPLGSSLLLMGNYQSCSGEPPDLRCDDLVEYQVEQGACVEITNPCGDHQWHRLDAFRLCDAPGGLYIRSERNPRRRFLCAAAGSVSQDIGVEYYYVSPNNSGLGRMNVRLGNGLQVVATAAPDTIPLGGASQLDAVVSGGVPPLSFAWSPSRSLNQSDLQSPLATPDNSTNFTVTVTDAEGVETSALVLVKVGVGLVELSADPAALEPGASATLFVIPGGGTPPYTYLWEPAAGLSDPTIANPGAAPQETTNYTVVVTDALGASVSGSILVQVLQGPGESCVQLTELELRVNSAADLALFADPVDAPCFEVVGNLQIEAPDLANLAGLEKLRGVFLRLEIENNPLLTSLGGLENLDFAATLALQNNPLLRDLSALGNLNSPASNAISLGNLIVSNNPDLTDLGGLEGLVQVGDMRILFNAGLTSLTGLQGLTAIGNHLTIADNIGLVGVDGLENLTHIGGSLIIRNNGALTNLNGLANLQNLGALTILDNPQLPTSEVEALRDRLAGLGFAGAVDIRGNGP